MDFGKISKSTYLDICRSIFFYSFDTVSFALRGNVLELAIGIIIGTAFANVVQSLVDDIISPPLGLVLGGVDFVNLTIKMNNFVYPDQPPVVIRYGRFIQTVIALLFIALILLFISKAAKKLHEIAMKKKEKKEIDSEIKVSDELKVLCEIRDLLSQRQRMDSISIRI